MAGKKSGGGAKPKVEYSVAKVRADVLDKCRIAASMTGDTLADFISKHMLPIADRVIDEQYAKLRPEGSPKPKRP